MWLVLSSIIFIFGFIIVLFPYSLPATIVQRAAASLLSLANTTRENSEIDEEEEEETPKRNSKSAYCNIVMKFKINYFRILR